MSMHLRLRLPQLQTLDADAQVEWVCMKRGRVEEQGEDTLRRLGGRYAGLPVLASLDVRDLVLMELTVPPLSGRHLKAALQGELEAMLLDDLQAIAWAHGPQAADGNVPVAWLAQAGVMQTVALMSSCGLSLRGLYPTLLPLRNGMATLQCKEDQLVVRTGRDRGFVQWCNPREPATTVALLSSRLLAMGIDHVQWMDAIPPWWSGDIGAELVPPAMRWDGPLPGWSLPLPTVSRRFPHIALGLGVAAMLVCALGLQWQTLQWRHEARALRLDAQQRFKSQFPEVADVVDPVLQARRALDAPAPPKAMPEVQQLLAATLKALPELAGTVGTMGYRPGELRMVLDTDAQATLDDAQRMQQWRQALGAAGLQLRVDKDNVMHVSRSSR